MLGCLFPQWRTCISMLHSMSIRNTNESDLPQITFHPSGRISRTIKIPWQQSFHLQQCIFFIYPECWTSSSVPSSKIIAKTESPTLLRQQTTKFQAEFNVVSSIYAERLAGEFSPLSYSVVHFLLYCLQLEYWNELIFWAIRVAHNGDFCGKAPTALSAVLVPATATW